MFQDNMTTKVSVGAVATVAAASALTYLYKQYLKDKPPTKWKRVGEIVQINFFPIKSCGPIQPMEINCGIYGVEEGVFRDRAFMVVTPENQFVTARSQPKLILIKPLVSGCKLILTAPEMLNAEIDFDELGNGESSKNTFWDQTICTVDCGDDLAIWISRFILHKDFGLRLVYCSDFSSNKPLQKWNRMHKITAKDSGMFQDNSSYMVINQSTVDEANKLLNRAVTPLQYRPNFVVNGPKAFEEKSWNWVKIGNDVILKYVNLCERCIIINVDPGTAERSPNHEPLNLLKANSSFIRQGKGIMGTLYGLRQSGKVHIGDPVYVEDIRIRNNKDF